MKISILQQDLLSPLQAVSRSTGVKSSLPVLGNILLQTENGKLTLSATNLEVGVVKKIKAEIIEEGEITVPAKMFLEVITSLSSQSLILETEGEQLKISSKNFHATLNCISATEFPAIPLASEQSISIEAKVLQQAVPQIAFAAAVDEGRPVLTGVLTELKKDKLELVSTDGFRLAHKQTKIEHPEEAVFRSLIPRRTFEEVVRLIGEELSGKEDKIEISTSENQNQMVFTIGETQLSSRLIEGQFPSWEKIIPTQATGRAVLERADVLKAVKIASVFAKDSANVIKLEVKEGRVILSSETRELGSQVTEIDAQVTGESAVIAFNSRFLQDALSACSTAQIVLEFSGSVSPVLIKPIGEEGLEYVIMPVRLS